MQIRQRRPALLLRFALAGVWALVGLTPVPVGPAATAAASAASAACAPLPAPSGTIVNVATVAQLQNAVAALTSNTTILIADGVYDLTNTLNIRGVNNVALRSASGNREGVELRGRGMSNASYGNVPHVLAIYDASDVTIADLTLRDAYYHLIQVHGEDGPQRPRFHNLHLIDSGEQFIKGSTGGAGGPYSDGGVVACSRFEYTTRARSDYTNAVDVLAGADWVIRDNVFRNIRAPQGQLAGPAVLMWRNSIGTIVERNLFIECDRAIALGLSAPDGNSRYGETTYDHQGGVVRNNFIYRAGPGDVGITANYAANVQVLHNTVILNDTFAWAIEYRFASTNATVRYNLTDGPILARNGAQGALLGNLTDAAPGWFVNAQGADLHLTAAATAAIDHAAPLAAVLDDFDGQTRPIGASPDVGADEYAAPTPTRVSDLRITSHQINPGTLTVTLNWSALPGATAFIVKGAIEPITAANWDSHNQIGPELPGTASGASVTIDSVNGVGYFAIKYRNAGGVLSEISNPAFWPRLEVFLPLVRR